MEKIKNALLIDDDESTNFINRITLQRSGSFDNIYSIDNAEEALSHIVELFNAQSSVPEIIFLDINMPGMNGWEFLNEYKHLPTTLKEQTKIFMLTTSLNPEDETKAYNIPEIEMFLKKPLTIALVDKINQHLDLIDPQQK